MKRILWNLIGVLLLSLAIAATRIPVETMEAAGDSSDFQLDGTTLVKYTGTAYTVSVPDEVKTIGEEAFYGNRYVRQVRLPKNLETIEYGAFGYCSALTKIQIPDSVTSIGSGAFACCPSLASAELGAGVKDIGNGVFAGCTALKTIGLDRKNKRFAVEKGVLYDAERTKIYQYSPGRTESVYNMPDTVKNIDKYAFWGCQNLETIALNGIISEIPGYAFSNCRSLKEIELPYSIHSIGAKAFEDCIGLQKVDLPLSLQKIHETAFDGCVNLTLTGAEGSAAGEYADAFNSREKAVQAEYEDIQQTIHPPAGTDSDTLNPDAQDSGEEGFNEEGFNAEDFNEDTLDNLLGSTTIVGNQAVVFIDNSSGQVLDGGILSRDDTAGDSSALMNETDTGSDNTSGSKEGQESLPENPVTDSVQSDGKGIHIPKYTRTPDGSIADQAYYKKSDLTTYTIPDGTKKIGDFAFARSGLTSITIPEGVTQIGYGAFYHCDNLNQVTLPASIEEIEPEAFEKTGWIENWKKSGSGTFLTAGNGILLAYNGSEPAVTIPEGVRIIAPGVFAEHVEITSVVLPDSLETIGEGAFEACSRLKQVSGGTNVLRIKDRAFAGCPLETIRIPDSVEELGLRAYDFSGLNLSSGEKTVVFHGQIPKVTYEKTAQRLSNKEYRGKALEDVSYAVIDKNSSMDKISTDNVSDSLKGTVLDAKEYGFKGVIISIDSDTDMTASVRGTTLTAEELVYFEPSETVEIYGRQYLLQGIEQLETLAEGNSDDAYHNEGSVLIQNKVDGLDTGLISAELSENTDSFYLRITQSDEALQRITEAFYAVYGMEPPANLKVYDLTLLEEESGVSITKLGKQTMRITMPLPAGLEAGTLFIISADSNGQLEDIPYWYEETEGEHLVTFETSHFSDFGFYTSGTSLYAEGAVTQGKAVIGSYGIKDDSPNTGDLVHPKWFLAGGLLFAALAVFFYRRRPGKQN